MKKIYIFLTIITVIFISACENKTEKDSQENKEQQKIVSVSVVPAKKADIFSEINLVGTVEAIQEAKISAKIGGRIDQIFVKEGDTVQPSQTLIQLDKSDLILVVEQAKTTVNMAKANLNKVLAGTRSEMIEQTKARLNQALEQLSNVRKDWEKMKELHGAGAISKQTIEKTETQYKIAQQDVKAAKESLKMAESAATKEDINLVLAQINQAQAALASANHQLTNTSINAPIGGMITQKIANTGEMASPGVPLLIIKDISIVKIKSAISENLIKYASIGKPVKIKLEAYPDKSFNGTIQQIGSTVNPTTRTFELEIHVSNQNRLIRPGMFARVGMILDHHKNVLTIPAESIFNKGEDSYTYIVKNNTAHLSPKLTLGISDMEKVEVSKGVSYGQEVVIRGMENLFDGIKVIVKKESKK